MRRQRADKRMWTQRLARAERDRKPEEKPKKKNVRVRLEGGYGRWGVIDCDWRKRNHRKTFPCEIRYSSHWEQLPSLFSSQSIRALFRYGMVWSEATITKSQKSLTPTIYVAGFCRRRWRRYDDREVIGSTVADDSLPTEECNAR